MNSNFNRQFILIDFRLLDNRDFLKFIASSEYATYLVLRRFIWRSPKPHHMGLHELYLSQRLLASSINRDGIAKVTGVDRDNISRHLSRLVEKKIIQRVRTGRQNIFVLGEWVDVLNNASYRGVEWFFLDGTFGITKSDLTDTVRSDLTPPSDQDRRSSSGQIRRSASDPKNNREGNREKNKNGLVHPVGHLPNLEQPHEQTKIIAQEILAELGDNHSLPFYQLVAAKIPYDAIRQALSELRTDGAKQPPRAFTHRMSQVALRRLETTVKRKIGSSEKITPNRKVSDVP